MRFLLSLAWPRLSLAVLAALVAVANPLPEPARAASGHRANPPAAGIRASGGVAENGALAVRGTQLVNAAGVPIQLRGMSTHGLQWYPQYANREAIRELKSHGANLFRIAMYADSNHGGYNENKETRAVNLFNLERAVEASLAENMYTIIDWHLLEDKTPLRHMESAKRFFDAMGRKYAGNPAIIYEICNEPNGDTTWADITAYAKEVIPVIRAHSPEAVILVGTPNFSSDLDSMRAAPLPFSNIMYAFHYYPGLAGDRAGLLLKDTLARGFPVFVSEWGIDKNPATGDLELDLAQKFVDFMQRRAISWANWSLSNKDESFSAIASGVDKLHGWTGDDLTPSGKLVFRALRGRPFRIVIGR